MDDYLKTIPDAYYLCIPVEGLRKTTGNFAWCPGR